MKYRVRGPLPTVVGTVKAIEVRIQNKEGKEIGKRFLIADEKGVIKNMYSLPPETARVKATGAERIDAENGSWRGVRIEKEVREWFTGDEEEGLSLKLIRSKT